MTGGRGRAWVAGSAALALLGGCAPAPVGQTPRTGIVSLNPCTDAVLAEVAAPGQLRALSAYSNDPASSSMDVAVARRLPAVTGTVEEIVALRPALVIGSSFTPPATRQALARLGIRLEEFPIASTVPESLAQVRRLAALAGQPARGEALVERIEAALAGARPRDGQAVPALVWQSGGIVPGDQSLIADLLRRTGFTNAAAARGLGQADYLPLERLLADPPAVILTASARGEADRLLGHPALAHLPGHRARLDPSLLWCGGPTIAKAAARLAQVRGEVLARGSSLAAPPPTPSSEEEGALARRAGLPLIFRGGGRGVVRTGRSHVNLSTNISSPLRRQGPNPTLPAHTELSTTGGPGLGPCLRRGDGARVLESVLWACEGYRS